MTSACEPPSIYKLWSDLGLEGQPSRKCRCPFHDDRNPSFSITEDGRGFKCFGCGRQGGVLEFVSEAFSGDKIKARSFLFERAHVCRPRASKTVLRSGKSPLDPWNVRHFVDLPCGTEEQMEQLRRLRGISAPAIRETMDRGLLRFARWKGKEAFLVGDSTGLNIQARRLDGGLWKPIGDAKSWTIPGSRAAFPIGLQEAEPYPCLLLVEGMPDLIAAHELIICHAYGKYCAAVAILGASHRIPNAALERFRGKRVRIYYHDDESGIAAGCRWRDQLDRHCDVDLYRFRGLYQRNGKRVRDMNDLMFVDESSVRKFPGLLEGILPKWEGGSR